MRRNLTTLAIILGGLVFALPSVGHDMPVKRSAIAQIHDDHIEFLLMYSESPGPRSELLLAKYDLDKDGRIDGPKERMLALPEISKRIAVGMSLEIPGESPQMARPEIKVTKDKGGGLSAALLIRYDVAKMKPGDTRALKIRLHDRKGNTPLTALIEAADGLAMLPSETAPNDGRETTPITINPGQEITVNVELPAEDATASDGDAVDDATLDAQAVAPTVENESDATGGDSPSD